MNILTFVLCLLSTLSFVQDNRSDLERVRALRASAETTRDYRGALSQLQAVGAPNPANLEAQVRAERSIAIAEILLALDEREKARKAVADLDVAAWPELQARLKALRNPMSGSLADTVRELVNRGDYENLRSLGASAAPAIESILTPEMDQHPNWTLFNILATLDGVRAVEMSAKALPRMRLALRLQLISTLAAARLQPEVLQPVLVPLLADQETSHSTLQNLIGSKSLEFEPVRAAFLKMVDRDTKTTTQWLRNRANFLDLASTWEALAQHPDPDLRALAQRNLLQVAINTRGSINHFGFLADSPYEEVRMELCRALQTREPNPMLQQIALRLAKDPSANVRRQLLNAANANSLMSPEILRAFLDDSEPDLAQRAVHIAAERNLESVLASASASTILTSIQWSDFQNRSADVLRYCYAAPLQRRQELAPTFFAFAQDANQASYDRFRALGVALAGNHPRGLELLQQLLKEPKVLAYGRQSIGEIRQEDRVQVIERIAALPEYDTEVIASLIEPDLNGPQFTESCIEACVRRFVAWPTTANVILAALDRMLRGVRPGPKALEYAKLMMSQPATASVGQRFIGSTRMPEQFPLLAAWVMDPANEGASHGSAIEALLRYGNDEAANLMLERLVGAPGKLRDPYQKALQQLTEFFEQRTAWQERLAKGNSRANAVQELTQLCEDKEPNVRAAAARSLARLDAVDELPRLVRMLKDESPLVRSAAEESLAQLQKPR